MHFFKTFVEYVIYIFERFLNALVSTQNLFFEVSL